MEAPSRARSSPRQLEGRGRARDLHSPLARGHQGRAPVPILRLPLGVHAQREPGRQVQRRLPPRTQHRLRLLPAHGGRRPHRGIPHDGVPALQGPLPGNQGLVLPLPRPGHHHVLAWVRGPTRRGAHRGREAGEQDRHEHHRLRSLHRGREQRTGFRPAPRTHPARPVGGHLPEGTVRGGGGSEGPRQHDPVRSGGEADGGVSTP